MPWLPEGPLFPDYGSTNDERLDAELIAIEDEGAKSFEEILGVCRRYRVRARLFQPPGYLIGTLEPNGDYTAA